MALERFEVDFFLSISFGKTKTVNINAIKFYSSFGFNIEKKDEAIMSYVSKSLEVRNNLIRK